MPTRAIAGPTGPSGRVANAPNTLSTSPKEFVIIPAAALNKFAQQTSPDGSPKQIGLFAAPDFTHRTM
jgi:hypothetical protein